VLRRVAVGGAPVRGLDVVFAQLDEARRGRLAAAVGGFEQVLITAAVFDDVPKTLSGNVVRIRAGRVLEAGEE
jgi:DNA replication and repair protein RecF